MCGLVVFLHQNCEESIRFPTQGMNMKMHYHILLINLDFSKVSCFQHLKQTFVKEICQQKNNITSWTNIGAGYVAFKSQFHHMYRKIHDRVKIIITVMRSYNHKMRILKKLIEIKACNTCTVLLVLARNKTRIIYLLGVNARLIVIWLGCHFLQRHWHLDLRIVSLKDA